MRRRSALLTAAALALALSGCSGVTAFPGPQSLPEDLFASSRDAESAPAGFDDGVKRTPCGDITLTQGEQLAGPAVDCLNTAIATTSAELAVVAPTTEGDPIVTFYRTSPTSAGFEMYVNGTFDRYGPGEWSHFLCPGINIAVENGCVED